MMEPSWGHWEWDENENGIVFISNTTSPNSNAVTKSPTRVKKVGGCLHTALEIKFRDTVDTLDQIRFRRHVQRRVHPGEPDVVTLKDVKDVVLFQVLDPLPSQFINFFHEPAVDRFLRALIVYFQYFMQTWDELVSRRLSGYRKLPPLVPSRAQKGLGQSLTELRAVVTREYCSLLQGVGSLEVYHHKNSSSETDARLFELLYRVTARVVWVALHRRNLNLIEVELNRLVRGEHFNISKHRARRRSTNIDKELAHENFVLMGQSTEEKRKLLMRSPGLRDLMYNDHDYRIIGIGVFDFETDDPRIKFLKATYTAPEEDLKAEGVHLGILGQQRGEFDAMLFPTLVESDMDQASGVDYDDSQPNITVPLAKQYTTVVIPPYGEPEPVPEDLPAVSGLPPDTGEARREASKKLWHALKGETRAK